MNTSRACRKYTKYALKSAMRRCDFSPKQPLAETSRKHDEIIQEITDFPRLMIVPGALAGNKQKHAENYMFSGVRPDVPGDPEKHKKHRRL